MLLKSISPYSCWKFPLQWNTHIGNFFRVVVLAVLGFTTLLTSQVISVAFYRERQKSDKFCSEALIRLEVLLRAINLRHGTHGFTSLPKEVILRSFTLWKTIDHPARFEPANLGSSGEYDNHGTTGVDVRHRNVCDSGLKMYVILVSTHFQTRVNLCGFASDFLMF